MDNGIENPADDMSGQGNSQKLANDLNLALDMGYERRAAGSGLYTGYDSDSNTWELIVKYTGDIQSVAKRFGASAVVLLGGYAIVTMPQEHINEFADCAEVVYIEKPHRLFFQTGRPWSAHAYTMRGANHTVWAEKECLQPLSTAELTGKTQTSEIRTAQRGYLNYGIRRWHLKVQGMPRRRAMLWVRSTIVM